MELNKEKLKTTVSDEISSTTKVLTRRKEKLSRKLSFNIYHPNKALVICNFH